MTPREQAILITKCRRLFYNSATGDVMGLASGGGALEALTGEALILATFGHSTDIGCLEMYYTPLNVSGRPTKIDLAQMAECHVCVDQVKAAKQTHDEVPSMETKNAHEAALGAMLASHERAITYSD